MALSAARLQTRGDGDVVNIKMTASTTIYQGGGVMFSSAGLALPAADTSGGNGCGVCAQLPNGNSITSGASIVTYVPVHMTGVFRFKASAAATATWVGQQVCWYDDETVALIGGVTNDVPAGICVDVIDASTVDVWINAAPVGVTW